jgi:hypothetical protein
VTVSWGSYSVVSGTGLRVGIQVESTSTVVNGSTTCTIGFTIWSNPGGAGASGSNYNGDNCTVSQSASAGSLSPSSFASVVDGSADGSSGPINEQHGGTQSLVWTYSDYGVAHTVDITVGITGLFNGSTPTKTLTVNIPARPWANPDATTAVSASRVSDTQASVAWTNHDAASKAYASLKVYRKDDAGSYALRATLGASAVSYSDTGIVANHKYRFRPNVLGANGFETTGAESGDIWTTPGAPTGLTATKLANGNIRLDWANHVNYSEYTTRIEESQNGGAFSELTSVSNGVITYEHVAPSTSVTHTYRVRARSTTGSLNSAYSANSNTVVLLATANPPTSLAPSGVGRDATSAIVFTWQHNPADGTPQSKYQLQYKIDAGSYVTVGPTSSSVSSYSLPAATLTNGHTITWHVATAGENGTLSAYSADATFPTSAVPTVNISAPTGTYNLSGLTVAWTYFQEQSSAQATWSASLYDNASNLLEQISGTTESSGVFATALADGASYTVKVSATSAAGLTSALDTQAFTVTYLPPAAVVVTAAYDELSGSMVVTLVGDAPTGGVTVAIDTVTLQRSINGGDWVTVTAGIVLSGSPLTAIVLDLMPTINGSNSYRALVFSATPSSGISSEVVNQTAEKAWSFLSAGPGFARIVRMRAAPKFAGEASRVRALRRFADREKPVQFEGTGVNLAVGVEGTLRDDSSTVEEYEAIASVPGIVLWREPTGRRIFASLAKVRTARTSHIWAEVSFDLTEIDYTE